MVKVIRKQTEEIDWEQVKDVIANNAFQVGDEIEIDERMWRVLDVRDKAIFIWQYECFSKSLAFSDDGEDSNSYEGSALQRYAREEFPKLVPEGMVRLVSAEGFNPLSREEVKKYLPTEDVRIVSDEGGSTRFWWMRDRVAGYPEYADAVYPNGCLLSIYVYNTACFAPACWLEAKD